MRIWAYYLRRRSNNPLRSINGILCGCRQEEGGSGYNILKKYRVVIVFAGFGLSRQSKGLIFKFNFWSSMSFLFHFLLLLLLLMTMLFFVIIFTFIFHHPANIFAGTFVSQHKQIFKNVTGESCSPPPSNTIFEKKKLFVRIRHFFSPPLLHFIYLKIFNSLVQIYTGTLIFGIVRARWNLLFKAD